MSELDLLKSTELFGIYNPMNFHSFQSTHQLFIPEICDVCNKYIYPLYQVCRCLRCKVFSHRECVMKQKNCRLFTFLNQNDSSILTRGFSSSFSSNLYPVRVSPKSPTSPTNSKKASVESDKMNPTINNINVLYSLELHGIVEKALMIPSVLKFLPDPGSKFCIWISILRAVAIKQDNIPTIINGKDDVLNTVEFSTRVMSILEDMNNFPAQVASVCFFVFISINFEYLLPDDTTTRPPSKGVTVTRKILQHVRQTFDSILCAILSVSANDIIEKDEHAVKTILYCIEKFMLSKDGGIMSEKINGVLDSQPRPRWMRKKSKAFDWTEIIPTNIFTLVTSDRLLQLSKELIAELSPHSKLSSLVEIIRYISSPIEHQTNHSNNNSSNHNNNESNNNNNESNNSNDSSSNTVDSQLSPVTHDTDELIQIFSLMIGYQYHEHQLNWYREYQVLSSDLLVPECYDIHGMEGYALITFQQAMEVLNSRKLWRRRRLK